jgi:hypothetical protein
MSIFILKLQVTLSCDVKKAAGEEEQFPEPQAKATGDPDTSQNCGGVARSVCYKK